ncbi:MAG: hypothetical protein QOH60_2757 [Mycobacterium sp.]|nr:hypothetical protein [Mycobacterium sp.]
MLASVIAFAGGAVLFASPANAANGNTGGIAYSPADKVYGWANHATDREDAIDNAIAPCENKGGKKWLLSARYTGPDQG